MNDYVPIDPLSRAFQSLLRHLWYLLYIMTGVETVTQWPLLHNLGETFRMQGF